MNKIINNNGYDYVDLKLPSETLWATCNVGAEKPSDYGLYFQWGDTIGYTKEQIGKDKPFSKDKYKWSIKGCDKNFIKYTTEVAILNLEDDAANANMGGDWHMPTPGQIKELINETTSIWTTKDGVNGRLFTSKKDTSKSIFIPAAGYVWNGSLYDVGSSGSIWSSVLSEGSVGYGQSLVFNSGNVYLGSLNCNFGRSVRGVIG